MKEIAMLSCLAVLASCARPVSSESVDSLAAHPDRLQQVMRQCRDDRSEMGDPICNNAREAFRRRFMGSGKAQYTPKP
jgi:hypothetical protein